MPAFDLTFFFAMLSSCDERLIERGLYPWAHPADSLGSPNPAGARLVGTERLLELLIE